MKALLGIASCLLALTISGQAEARKVYLNNLDLDRVMLTNLTLKRVDVRIDSKGHIYITARGYKIQVDGGTTPRRPTSSTSVGSSGAKYYLVSFFNKKAATQYDIEVFINKRMVRRIRSYHDQIAMEVTKYIRRGQKNEIVFVSRKNLGGGGRTSTSSMDYFRVVIGVGFDNVDLGRRRELHAGKLPSDLLLCCRLDLFDLLRRTVTSEESMFVRITDGVQDMELRLVQFRHRAAQFYRYLPDRAHVVSHQNRCDALVLLRFSDPYRAWAFPHQFDAGAANEEDLGPLQAARADNDQVVTFTLDRANHFDPRPPEADSAPGRHSLLLGICHDGLETLVGLAHHRGSGPGTFLNEELCRW